MLRIAHYLPKKAHPGISGLLFVNYNRRFFDFSERLSKATSHRILAIRRGESEGILRVNISPDEDAALERLDKRFLKGDNDNEATNYVADAIEDAYKRLLKPSIETEFAFFSIITLESR